MFFPTHIFLQAESFQTKLISPKLLLNWKNIARKNFCLFLDETSNAEIIMVFSSRVIEFSIGGKLNDLAVKQIALFRGVWEYYVSPKNSCCTASAARRGHDMTFSSLTWCVSAAFNKQVTTSIYQLRCNSKEKTVKSHASQVLIMGQIICSLLDLVFLSHVATTQQWKHFCCDCLKSGKILYELYLFHNKLNNGFVQCLALQMNCPFLFC